MIEQSELKKIKNGCTVEYVSNKNLSMVERHQVVKEQIKKVLRESDHIEIKFYKNYIRLNGKCYNGITQEIFSDLMKEVRNESNT